MYNIYTYFQKLNPQDQAVVFVGYSSFLNHIQLASHDLVALKQ